MSQRSGIYVNSLNPVELFLQEAMNYYYVDKSYMLEYLIPLAEGRNAWQENRNCIRDSRYLMLSRPRRFGKTTMAMMISSFFGKCESLEQYRDSVFESLKIAKHPAFTKHIGKYNVITLKMSEEPENCTNYLSYISRINMRLKKDLIRLFPDVEFDEVSSVSDMLQMIHLETKEQFIFVIDEWDYIFSRAYITANDRNAYIAYLSNLIKGQGYILFVYMTGVLPINKYSSGSELDMFYEYTIMNDPKFYSCFGFSDKEVDDLFRRYLAAVPAPTITREQLREWYDGYIYENGQHTYNPRSVVGALINNKATSYWTNTGPYAEIMTYVNQAVDAVREDIGYLVMGDGVPANVNEYAASGMELATMDQIFSAMSVYGFLTYHDGKVWIPNRELLGKFLEMIKAQPQLTYLNRLAIQSEAMMRAMKEGDTEKIAEIMMYLHNTETPLLKYGNEQEELTALVTIACLSGRENYHIVREDKGGTGYADFLFYPVIHPSDDCYVLELKVDDTPENAILQIKQKQYALAFAPKSGKPERYSGRIIAYGIAYLRNAEDGRIHRCVREILRG